ncbi:MAG TPA: hypothetical protein VJX67_05240, partial [Blastocatellia bacterium]|nr:hypothetical protein [Blastocatellia bacterium]
REFRKAVAIEPSYMGVLNNSVISSFGGEGDWQRAITVLRFVLSIDPSYAPARENLAVAFLNYGYDEARNGHLELAIDIYATAMAIEATVETRLQIRINLASAFTTLGEMAGRNRHFDKSWVWMLKARNFYQSAATMHNLGLAYARQAFALWEAGDFSGAVEFFLRAQDIGFINSVVSHGYAVALNSAGRTDEAELAWERARALDSQEGTPPKASRSVDLGAMPTAFQHNGNLGTFGQLSPAPQNYMTPIVEIASPVYKVAA